MMCPECIRIGCVCKTCSEIYLYEWHRKDNKHSRLETSMFERDLANAITKHQNFLIRAERNAEKRNKSRIKKSLHNSQDRYLFLNTLNQLNKLCLYCYRGTDAYKQYRSEVSRKGTKKAWENPEYRKRMQSHLLRIRHIKGPTSIEIKTERLLKKLKVNYEAEKPIGKYFADFFIPSRNLVIECDGEFSHGDPRKFKSTDLLWGHKPAQKKWDYDKERDAFFKNQGYTVLRFWEHDIKHDFGNVKKSIKNTLGI